MMLRVLLFSIAGEDRLEWLDKRLTLRAKRFLRRMRQSVCKPEAVPYTSLGDFVRRERRWVVEVRVLLQRWWTEFTRYW